MSAVMLSQQVKVVLVDDQLLDVILYDIMFRGDIIFGEALCLL